MSSFLKYAEDGELRKGNGRGSLSFSRAHVDGMPFRGPSMLLKEEEYDEYTEQVNDVDVGIFDIRNPEDYRAFKTIFDRAGNGWYQILDYAREWGTREDGSKTVFVFVMYGVPHRELAKNRALANLQPTPVPEHPAPWRHGG